MIEVCLLYVLLLSFFLLYVRVIALCSILLFWFFVLLF